MGFAGRDPIEPGSGSQRLPSGEGRACLGRLPPVRHAGRVIDLTVTAPWPVGMGILVAWAAGTWIAGAALLERRDV